MEVLQTLARHAGPKLTLMRYSRVERRDEVAAIEAMPDLARGLAGKAIDPPSQAATEGDADPPSRFPSRQGTIRCLKVQQFATTRALSHKALAPVTSWRDMHLASVCDTVRPGAKNTP